MSDEMKVAIVNPKSNKAPFPERGFKIERFQPLAEDLTESRVEQGDAVTVNA